ncbi:hypothetical protein BVC93_31775 (plasmid) [Mycobacterium sp. MS1601]|uniref:hypothetical protein n=1 Tax=Mycobacterium sp. MS1601 TaxID=1936029 RepID=UPI0009794F59|nr:hypothetical protein [Mycobacterium sp. MS1601]AQA07071.1 hypothetical protein BVC93_31775 [Mycobacterium sp. MS1601]
MTDIQVLLQNIQVVATGISGTLLMLWGLFYFFKNLFGEGGRQPVKIAIGAAVIAGAAGVYSLIPSLIDAGSSTGEQIGGGGGYSMPAFNVVPSPIAVDNSAQAAA